VKAALQYLHEILTLVGEDRRKIPGLVILFLGVSVLDLAGIGLIAPYISIVMQPDTVGASRLVELISLVTGATERNSLLYWLSVLLITLFIFKAIAMLLANHFIISFAQNQQIRLRARLMNVYQNMPYEAYLQRNSAEYLHSIQTLVPQFQLTIQQILRTISDALVGVAIFVLLVLEAPNVTFSLVVLLGGVTILYDRIFRKKLKNYGIIYNNAANILLQGTQEGLDGFKEIRILGKENYFYQKVYFSAKIFALNQKLFLLIQSAPRYLFEVFFVSVLVVYVILMLEIDSSAVKLFSSLGMFGLAAIRLMPMGNQLATTLSTIRFNRDAIRRIYNDINRIRNTSYQVSKECLLENFISLKLKDVEYVYPNMKSPAIGNINLEITNGESIGLIGPSGSGKTTMVDVLLGLLEPRSGLILFNGKSVLDNLGMWQSQVAYLPQQVFLIDNTLRCNIALGEEDQEIDNSRLQEALQQARLSKLVEELPQGVDTFLGERGVRLSGGQRQRVALARAFYHGRSVLVMDEATSALDNETEREIVEEIKRLKGKKTMIVIAHRLTTVQHCDRIYQLDNGKIIREGTPQKILQKAV
jgi:ABC-type multidrug transport system fused ATPase/permease subunit